jgi:hypothetical protein
MVLRRANCLAWKDTLADIRAQIEADLDFADEDDVPGSIVDSLPEQLLVLKDSMEEELSSHVAERVRDGFRVVLAGAPNSGKSTLLNALLERDAALVSPIAGTTRDQIDVPIDLDGLPVVLTDTAGLRDSRLSEDPIERWVWIGLGLLSNRPIVWFGWLVEMSPLHHRLGIFNYRPRKRFVSVPNWILPIVSMRVTMLISAYLERRVRAFPP